MASGAELALKLIMTLKDEVTAKTKPMQDALKGIGTVALGAAGLAAGGIAALAAGLAVAGKAAAEEQVGIAALGAAVTASGANWDVASAAIEDYLDVERKRVAMDDGEGRAAIQALTQSTGDYNEALKLMPLVADLAAAKGMDLASAAELVGKVSQGNTGILQRYGISLDSLAKSTTQTVVDTKALAEAQAASDLAHRKAAIAVAEVDAKLQKAKPGSLDYQKLMIQKEEILNKVAAADAKVATTAQGSTRVIKEEVTVQEALALMQSRFAGQGEAFAGTVEGQQKRASIAFGNLKETIGTAVLPIMAQLAEKTALFAEKAMPVVIAAVEKFAPILQGLVTIVVEAVRSFGNLSDVPWEDMLPKELVPLAVNLSKALDKVHDAFKQVSDWWNTSGKPVFDKIVGFVQANMQPILIGLATALAAIVVPAFVAWAVAAGAAAAATIVALAPVVAPILAIAAAAALLAKAWSENWGDIQGKTEAVVTFIKGIIEAFLKAVQAWWDEHGEKVMFIVTTLWEGLQKLIDSTITVVKGIIEAFLKAVQEWWDKHGKQVEQIVSELWKAIQGIVETFVGIIEDLIDVFMQVLKGDWEGVGKAIVELWSGMWEGLRDLVESLGKVLLGALALVIESLVEAWGALAESLPGIWTATWEAIKTGLSTAWAALMIVLGVLMEALKQFFLDRLAEIATWGTNLVEGIKSGFVTKWSELMTSAGELIGNITQLFLDRLGEITSWGANLVEGIKRGIVDKWNDLTSTIGGLIERLLGWIRDLLDMRSPSGVMAEIGLNMMLGWLAGLTEGQQAVLNEMSDIAGKLMGIMSDMATMIERMSTTTVFPNWEVWVTGIKTLLGLMRDALLALYDFPGGPMADALNQAKNISNEWAPIIRLLGDAVQAIADMAGLNETQNILPKIEYFIAAFSEVVFQIVEDAAIWAGDARAALSHAAGAAEDLAALMQVVKPAVDALTALASYLPVTLLPSQMKAFRDNLLMAMRSLTDIFKVLAGPEDSRVPALTAAAALADTLIEIIGLIKPAIDALVALDTWWPSDQLWYLTTRLTGDLKYLVSSLATMALQLGEDMGESALSSAADIAQSLLQIIALIQPAIDALVTLDTWWPSDMLWYLTTRLTGDLKYLVSSLATMALQLGEDMGDSALSSAADIAQSMLQIVALIQPAIDALTALDTWWPSDMLWYLTTRLTGDLKYLVSSLTTMANELAGEGLDAAARAATSLMAIIGLVQPAIEAILALAAFKNIAMPDDNVFDNFVNWFEMVIQVIVRVADRFQGTSEQAAFGAAQAFATAVQAVVSIINPAIEAIAALFAFKNLPMPDDDVFDNFINWFEMVVRSIIRIADRFQGESDQEAFGAAQVFATAVQSVINLVKPGIEAIIELAAFKNIAMPNDDVFDNFVNWFEMVVRSIVRVADRFGGTSDQEALGAAVAFSAAATRIIEIISPMIEAIGKLLDYEAEGLPAAMEAFLADFATVITGIAALAKSLTDTGLPAARKFEELCKAIKEAVLEGLAQLGALEQGSQGSVAQALGAFAAEAKRSMEAARQAVADALTQIANLFSSNNGGILNAAYSLGWNIGDAIERGLNANLTSTKTTLHGVTLSVSDVQWYAGGGDFVARRPTLIGVGEAGPERVQVTPMGAGSAGGSAGKTYQLTYIDQRQRGGPPNLVDVMQQLEWEANMRA